MALDLSRHPCFDDKARHQFARMHLPVAPKCNIRCNYCDRKNDCPNENRPGVTSALLSPEQALEYVRRVSADDPSLTVVGIAGPGDPFATPDLTLRTLRLVREEFPEMLLCVASNGLGVPPHAKELGDLRVGHVTITINAVDPAVGEGIYHWVRDGQEMVRGRKGAALLLERQLASVDALVANGVAVKVNCIVVPGVNDHHVVEVAKELARRGASVFNALPLKPVLGTPFATIDEPGEALMAKIREGAGQHIPQMTHCTRCRADAVGRLGAAANKHHLAMLKEIADTPAPGRKHVAVVSLEGALVNQHLGEAEEIYVFAPSEEGHRLVERRPAPPEGRGADRWRALAELIPDCGILLAHGAGEQPKKVLGECGVRLIVTEGLVDDALDAVQAGRDLRPPRQPSRCGDSCGGDGRGCG